MCDPVSSAHFSYAVKTAVRSPLSFLFLRLKNPSFLRLSLYSVSPKETIFVIFHCTRFSLSILLLCSGAQNQAHCSRRGFTSTTGEAESLLMICCYLLVPTAWYVLSLPFPGAHCRCLLRPGCLPGPPRPLLQSCSLAQTLPSFVPSSNAQKPSRVLSYFLSICTLNSVVVLHSTLAFKLPGVGSMRVHCFSLAAA